MWDELVSTAIVGTTAQAAPITAVSDGLSAALAGLNPDDREAHLLAAAGLTAMWRLAGARPARDSRPVPDPCEPESAPTLGPRASHYLERMLAGQFQEVLPEFLEAMSSPTKVVPPELVPDLLEKARENAPLRRFLPKVTGRRGQWLAAKNPLWRDLAAAPDEAVWETGKSDERVALLSHLRATNPGRAIELLASTWKQESAKDRPIFLAQLSNGLGLEDEPFLEEALTDNRIEVRRAATGLLARLPGSRLSAEAREILFSSIELKTRLLGKSKLEISLTDDLPNRLKAARIDLESVPGSAAFKTLGQKAKLLYQIVAITPPAAWTDRFERAPERLVEAARESDWSVALMAGWTEALARHPQAEWTQSLIRLNLSPSTFEPALAPVPESAMKALPRDTAEELIAEALKFEPIIGDHPALLLIAAFPGPWSERLSRMVIQSARRQVTSLQPYQRSIFDALGQCGLKMPPQLASEFGSGWRTEAGALDRTIKLIDEFVALLTFRRDMLASIASSA